MPPTTAPYEPVTWFGPSVTDVLLLPPPAITAPKAPAVTLLPLKPPMTLGLHAAAPHPVVGSSRNPRWPFNCSSSAWPAVLCTTFAVMALAANAPLASRATRVFAVLALVGLSGAHWVPL